MNFRPRRALGAAAVSLAVLAMAGCGGSDDEPTSSASVTAASDATTSAAPDDASDETTAGGDSDANGLAKVISKSFNEGKSAHVVMEMGDQGSAEGDVAFGDGKAAMDLTMSIGGQDAQMRLVDGTMYVKQAQMGDKWIKLDVAEMGGQLEVPDPSDLIKQFEGAEADATQIEDGHWQFNQDAGTADLWVGDDGYIEKIVSAVSGAGEITMTYSDWGKDVDIEAPSAADVMEMPTS